MIPMHPHLISQLIAGRQAGLMASARQQRLARQARAARRARPQRGRAAPMLAALGRLARRRPSPRTIQTPAAGPGIRQQPCPQSPDIPCPRSRRSCRPLPLPRPQTGMLAPSDEPCGHHDPPDRAICARPRHHERSILRSADSLCAGSVPPGRLSQSRSVIAVPEGHYLERGEQARPWCPEIAVRYMGSV